MTKQRNDEQSRKGGARDAVRAALASDPTSDGHRPASTPRLAPRRWRFYAALLGCVVLLSLVGWKAWQVHSLRKEFSSKQAEMTRIHREELDSQASQLLRVGGELLRWTVSEPLASKDFETIESRIRPLVQEKPIMAVAVADSSGTVRSATNHKLEGQALTKAFPGVPELQSNPIVVHNDDGLYVFVPLFAGGASVGSAVIAFRHDHADE